MLEDLATLTKKSTKSTPTVTSTTEPAWAVIKPASPVRIASLRKTPDAWTTSRAGNRLALIGGDTQIGFRQLDSGELIPFHDSRAMEVFVQVAAELQPTDIIITGDFLDLASQSRWTQEAAFARTTQPALEVGHQWLAQLRAASPEARIVVIEGNHDKRMAAFVETNAMAAYGLKVAGLPTSRPVMTLPYLLQLDALNVEYVDAYPAATLWLRDDMRAIHGTRSAARASTMSQYLQEFPGVSTIAGHSHRQELISRTTFDARGPVESFGLNPGALCRIDGAVPSVHGGTHADGSHADIVEPWQQGFGILRYNESEAWPEVHRIHNGVAQFSGLRFEARPELLLAA